MIVRRAWLLRHCSSAPEALSLSTVAESFSLQQTRTIVGFRECNIIAFYQSDPKRSASSERSTSVSCKSCESTNQRVFESEISIHFPEFKNLKRGPVLAFSDLVVCLDCGFTEARIEGAELRALIEDRDESKGAAD